MENKTVFDFDGTLIRINSFPFWVLFLIFFSVLNFKFKIAIEVFKLLINRRLISNITHEEFKKSLIEIQITDAYPKCFSKLLSIFVRENLLEELKKHHSDGHKIAIASAAPEIYLREMIKLILPEIHEDLNISGATILNGKLNGNYKQEKLDNLYISGFIKPNKKIKTLYTDSWDDSYIADQSENIILVFPKKSCRKKFTDKIELSSKIDFFRKD